MHAGEGRVVGVQEILGTPAFVLRFLQCRDSEWIGKVFFAKYDDKAVWFDDLEPLDGMSLPWSEKGLPQPCIDGRARSSGWIRSPSSTPRKRARVLTRPSAC